MSPANRLNQIIDEQKLSKHAFAKLVAFSENKKEVVVMTTSFYML